MRKVKIKASYSFWRHPIKWIRERKARTLLELITNRKLEEWMDKELDEAIKNVTLYGFHIWKNK